ncbi:hypothetical protein ABIB75_007662 [Bradyrhizobium sp. GM2.2]
MPAGKAHVASPQSVFACPPLAHRISSRFECNAGSARREFVRAFEAYRSRNLHVLVSYSDTIRFRWQISRDSMRKSSRMIRFYLSAFDVIPKERDWAFGLVRGQVIEVVLVARP